MPHYFIAFDIYDTFNSCFLARERIEEMLSPLSIPIVPIVFKGKVNGLEQLLEIINSSSNYGAKWRVGDSNLMEGVYGKIEINWVVEARFKFVNTAFRETLNQLGIHHTRLPRLENYLAEGKSIYL